MPISNSGQPDELRRKADAAKAAIDHAVAAFDNPEELARQCDAYTGAAKDFAAMILAERVRQSFVDTIADENQKSTESVDEKLQHAREVRDWLAPWNLGFHDPETGAAFQLRARHYGTTGGGYRLGKYGEMTSASIDSWSKILPVVTNPQLCDVTHHIYHSALREHESGPKPLQAGRTL